MRHRILRTVTFALLLLGVLSSPAWARDRHRGHRHHGHHHRHHHHHHDRHFYRHSYFYGPRHIPKGPHFSIGFYANPFYGPYNPYTAPYYPPTVVYTPPVRVTVPAESTEVAVQKELAKRGYYGGEIDGKLGPRTQAAIRAYQVDKGLPVTGKIDGALLRKLGLL